MRKLFLFCSISILFLNISIIEFIVDKTYFGVFANIVYLSVLIVIFQINYDSREKIYWMYIFNMFLGILFHLILSNKPAYIFQDSIRWILLVAVLLVSNKYRSSDVFFYLLISFFILNSTVAILEFISKTNYIKYEYTNEFSEYYLENEFRAFALTNHPLASANVNIIIMSFILVNSRIKSSLKTLLILLGAISLFCFNSRAALIFFLSLFSVRYIFKGWGRFISITLAILFVGILTDITIFFPSGGFKYLGRLSQLDYLNDGSFLTRISSFYSFISIDWSLESIFLGGNIIYIPGTNNAIENGVLLTISWWGVIVGTLKFLLEILISYKMLINYDLNSRIIILTACWGVAFFNNNSFNTLPFAFLIFSFLSFKSIPSYFIR